MTDQKQTSIVVRENTEVSTKPQFGHRLISRAADDAIGFLPSPENVIEQKSTIKFFRFYFGSLARIGNCLGPSTIAAVIYGDLRYARELGDSGAEMRRFAANFPAFAPPTDRKHI